MFRLKHPHQLNFGKLIDPLESPRSIPSRPPWGTIKKLKPGNGAFKSIKLTSHSIPPNNDLYSLFLCQHWRRRRQRQRRRIGWVLQKVRFHLNSTPPPTPTHLQQERNGRTDWGGHDRRIHLSFPFDLFARQLVENCYKCKEELLDSPLNIDNDFPSI